MEREKNRLIDELSLKDQQLQQANTTSAELHGEIAQSKRNATRRHVQRNKAQAALQKSVMDNQTMRQAIAKAKQELKNIRQQIADGKSSAQPCNCDYDQLLNNIVHEPVDVNRHRLLSTANDVSRYCDSNPPAHHNRTADRSRFRSSKHLLEHPAPTILTTLTVTKSQSISTPETVDEFVQTRTETRTETTTSSPTSAPNAGTRD